MSDTTMDAGLAQVILERLEKQRLPRLLVIKQKVDDDISPDNLDLEFLEQSIADATRIIPLIDRHPEYQMLASEVMTLYKDISEKALQIEKSM